MFGRDLSDCSAPHRLISSVRKEECPGVKTSWAGSTASSYDDSRCPFPQSEFALRSLNDDVSNQLGCSEII